MEVVVFKISRDPVGRFSWWRKNKLFQIKANQMVHRGGPGNCVWCSNFLLEEFSLICQNLGKRSLVSSGSHFSALPGAERRDCFAPIGRLPCTIGNDLESQF